MVLLLQGCVERWFSGLVALGGAVAMAGDVMGGVALSQPLSPGFIPGSSVGGGATK